MLVEDGRPALRGRAAAFAQTDEGRRTHERRHLMPKSPAVLMVEVQTRPCPHCNKGGTVTVDAMGLSLWRDQGWPIQQALGEYSPDVREQIMSGFHPACWDEAFSDEEDDDGPCCIAFVTSGGRDEHVPGCTEEYKP